MTPRPRLSTMSRRLVRLTAAACLGGSTLGTAQPADDAWQPHPMTAQVQALLPQATPTLDRAMVGLWIEALGRPEAGTRLEAAEAFATLAGPDAPGLAEAAGGALVERYRREPDAQVRRALARALVAMEVQEAASLGWAAEDDEALHLLTDVALARWEGSGSSQAWHSRLTDASRSDADRASAARALALVRDPGLAAAVLPILRDPGASWFLRHALAEAAMLQPDAALARLGLELAGGDTGEPVLAALLLGAAPAEQSPSSVEALQALVRHDDPAVVDAALVSLRQVDPAAGQAAAADLVDHPDAAVRLKSVWFLGDVRPVTEAVVDHLVSRLGDPAVSVRTAASQALTQVHGEHSIERAVEATLAGDDWRALEQAASLAGGLDVEAAAPRLVALLGHDRPEVRVATATALRRVAVGETLGGVLERATALRGQGGLANPHDAEALTQLVLTLGELRHAPAEGLLREMVPKNPSLPGDARRAAVWSLGRLREGNPDPALLTRLAGRVNDRNELDPEDPEVKALAVLAVAQVGGAGEAERVRRWADDATLELEPRAAAHHAYQTLTGEALPPLPTPAAARGVWFLMPLR